MSPFFHKNVIDNFFTPRVGRFRRAQVRFKSASRLAMLHPLPTRTRNVLKPTSPFVSDLYAHSCNTRSEGSADLNMKTGAHPLTWKCCYPLPAGFPRNRSPLKGDPPFRGTPSALGHEGVRGRRLHGAAMLCRLQCARFTFGTRAQGRPRTAPPRRRHVMPLAMRPLREKSGALPAHVSSALGTHTVAAALKRASPCERLVSGSTPNEITSCHATSRSGCS